MASDPAYAPIADYALIGDCHGAALVRRDGSVDWICLRRFDAGSMFCALLDAGKGGCFRVTPVGEATFARAYRGDTMVLETTATLAGGTYRLRDAFAMRRGGAVEPHRQMIRCIECTQGEVELDVWIEPRFDYGSLRPWLHAHARHGTYSAVGGDDAMVVSTDVPLEVDRERVVLRARITLRAGESRFVAMAWYPSHAVDSRGIDAHEAKKRIEQAESWWNHWVAKGEYEGPYRDAVVRSALVLKTLTTAPTGAIVAAPSMSLPESIGGTRNWDYRYCWVRDAAFTMVALYSVGHKEVAEGFRRFIERATAGHAADMQILYGCYGERRLPELELPDLEGYRGSRPVRVGNAAASQRQLDIYGELLGALWVSTRAGGRPLDEDDWSFVQSVVEAAIANWRQADRGIWEMRGDPRHFVHSKTMCWVALDRGLRMAEAQHFDGVTARWTEVRDAIRDEILAHGVDPAGHFVQAYGASHVDASLLLLPLVGFVDARDPRMVATVAVIERDLTEGGLLMRYRDDETHDGVGGSEGVFLMCSFWLVDVLTLQGRIDDATKLFERLVGLANDVGLCAEQYDPASGAMLGNFPQAFTHVALINSARALGVARSGTR